MAGYLFEAGRIDQFCDEWNAMLDEYGVPYFHMVDCAHQAPPFDKLEKLETVHLQVRAMRIIKRFAINGIVCNITNKRDNSGSSYAECVERALGVVLDWSDKTAFSGNIAYFLEAGAQGQGLVDTNFGQIAQDPARAAAYRYAGHAFIPKQGNPGVQAADLLSWQYHNYTKKRAKASTFMRGQIEALWR